MRKKRQLLFLFFLVLFPSVFYVFLSTGKHNFINLPYYGNKNIASNGDTIYQSIPPFSFLNQEGESVTEKNFQDKIYIANFFFTTCKSICPAMSTQLIRVQERFKTANDVMILSHTVDPENDTVEVLKNYAQHYGAINGKWHFVTGDKNKIYTIAKEYLVNAMEGGENDEPFIHSEFFILVDKEKHIRAIYDGTSTADVNKLIEDINTLKARYAINEHGKKKAPGF